MSKFTEFEASRLHKLYKHAVKSKGESAAAKKASKNNAQAASQSSPEHKSQASSKKKAEKSGEKASKQPAPPPSSEHLSDNSRDSFSRDGVSRDSAPQNSSKKRDRLGEVKEKKHHQHSQSPLEKAEDSQRKQR